MIFSTIVDFKSCAHNSYTEMAKSATGVKAKIEEIKRILRVEGNLFVLF